VFDGLAEAGGGGVFRVALRVGVGNGSRAVQVGGGGFDFVEGLDQRFWQCSGLLQDGSQALVILLAHAGVWEGVLGGQKMSERGKELGEERQAEVAGDPRGGKKLKLGGRHRLSLSHFRLCGMHRGWTGPVQPWRAPLRGS
jgi:hypothetical protein